MVKLFLMILAVAPLSAEAPYVNSSPSASCADNSRIKISSSFIVLLPVVTKKAYRLQTEHSI